MAPKKGCGKASQLRYKKFKDLMANGMPGTLISKHIKHQLLKLKIKNKLLKQIYLKNN